MRAENQRIVLVSNLLKDKSIGFDGISATLKISKSTLYRYAGIERNTWKSPHRHGSCCGITSRALLAFSIFQFT
jgi:hypothetical protein